MTVALEGGEGSGSRPGRSLPPGKTRYPMYRRQGGPQGRSGQVRKISLQLGFDSRTVQPVASRYTDNATRPTNIFQFHNLNQTPPDIVHPLLCTRSKDADTLQKAQNSGNVTHALYGFVMPSLIVVCIIQMGIGGSEKPVPTHKSSRRNNRQHTYSYSYFIT